MEEERGNEGWEEEEERQVSSPAESRKRDAKEDGKVNIRFQVLFSLSTYFVSPQLFSVFRIINEVDHTLNSFCVFLLSV